MKFSSLFAVAALVLTVSTSSLAVTKCKGELYASKKAAAAVQKAQKKLDIAQKAYDNYDKDGGFFDKLQNQEAAAERQYLKQYQMRSDKISRYQSLQKQLEVNSDGRIISGVVGVLFGGKRITSEIDRQAFIRSRIKAFNVLERKAAADLKRLEENYEVRKARFAKKRLELEAKKATAAAKVSTLQATLDTANANSDAKDALYQACLATA